jgi:hypothetical protein
MVENLPALAGAGGKTIPRLRRYPSVGAKAPERRGGVVVTALPAAGVAGSAVADASHSMTNPSLRRRL